MKPVKLILFISIGILFVFINAKIAEFYFPDGFKRIVYSASDSQGYYQYLPSAFITDDLLNQPYAVIMKDGVHLNKYTCGVAIFETPFFFAAHQYSKMFGYETNGYSHVYGYFIVISTCVYLYIALYVLYLLLLRHFRKPIALLSVAVIYLGTNIYYYSIVEPGMSHVYSFFCFTMFLFFVDRYYKEQKLKDVIGLGFFLAMATLIRPTNLLLILLFVFYETYNFTDAREQLKFHLRRYYNFIILLVIGFIVFLPQILYWHALVGKYLFYSYQNETFSNWKSPKILEVLVGHKSSWLLYSPMMIFSLIGLIIAFRQKLLNGRVISIIFLIILYLCASWWAYTFGAAFGYRSFVEYSAILIFPMALFFERVFKNKNILFKILTTTAIVFFMYYNIKITRLYVVSGGGWDGPHWHWSNYTEMLKQTFTL